MYYWKRRKIKIKLVLVFGLDMRTSTAVLLLLTVILAPILVGVTIWEIEDQPLIDYTLSAPTSFNTVASPYCQVNLMVRNRGKIDATVLLVVTTKNATIQEINAPNVEYNNTSVSVRVLLPNGVENWSTGQTLNIIPLNNTRTFSVSYEVTKEFSWMSMVYTINPITPTMVTYNQTQSNIFTEIP
jgi:hypothetical protein